MLSTRQHIVFILLMVLAIASAVVAIKVLDFLSKQFDLHPIAYLLLLLASIVFLFSFPLIFAMRQSEAVAEKVSKFKVSVHPPIPKHEVRKVLQKYVAYYQQLSPQLKSLFVERVEIFVEMKEFVGRDYEVSKELKILIAACAAQLTFGLRTFHILHFKRIIIYKNAYYSKIRKNYHKGEVNASRRIIVLSADNFVHGMAIPDDGINLGLHELAHALSLDAILSRSSDSYAKDLRDWEIEARIWMDTPQVNQVLRKYAYSNIQEMLAVSTECFFEQPEALSKQMPTMYVALQQLYRQNPLKANHPLIN